MKRSVFMLLAFSLVVMAFAGLGSSLAASCTNTEGSTSDPFGSCENGDAGGTYGNVECGNGGTGSTDVPMVGQVLTPTDGSAQGVQACNDGSNGEVTPIQGRVTVYRSSGGNVMVATDSDDAANCAPAGNQCVTSWSRLDVRPNSSGCDVQVRRSASGWHWDGSSGNGTEPSTPDSTVCVVP